jgi:hypothetical protein
LRRANLKIKPDPTSRILNSIRRAYSMPRCCVHIQLFGGGPFLKHHPCCQTNNKFTLPLFTRLLTKLSSQEEGSQRPFFASDQSLYQNVEVSPVCFCCITSPSSLVLPLCVPKEKGLPFAHFSRPSLFCRLLAVWKYGTLPCPGSHR